MDLLLFTLKFLFLYANIMCAWLNIQHVGYNKQTQKYDMALHGTCMMIENELYEIMVHLNISSYQALKSTHIIISFKCYVISFRFVAMNCVVYRSFRLATNKLYTVDSDEYIYDPDA